MTKERLPVEIEETADAEGEDDTRETYKEDLQKDKTQGVPLGKEKKREREDDTEKTAEELAEDDLKDIEPTSHTYIRFLKAYAKTPNVEHTKIAAKMGITQSDANLFMKRFSNMLYKLRNEDSQIETATRALNNLVTGTEISIEEEDVQTLERHASRFIKGYNIKTTTSKVTSPVKETKREPTPQEEDREQQVKRYKENYSKLKNSSRSAVLRYVLENVPFVHNTEVEPIIAMFELQEEHLMASPQNMSRFCSSYLGNKVGPNVFETYSNIIQSLLPSDKQYGQPPWFQQQFQMGTGGMGMGGMGMGMGMGSQNPVNPGAAQYYYERNVIPFYMDINSPEAKIRIAEYHEKKAREDEEDKRNKDWDERMKRYMNLKMMDIVDPNARAGNGHSQMDMNQMVLAGLARAVPSTDDKGNFTWKYEATRSPAVPFGQQATGDPNSQLETMTKIMANMMEMFNKMRPPEQARTDTLSDTLVRSMVEKMPSMLDPLEAATRYKKLSETFTAPGNPQHGVEVGKLELAKEKMKQDFDFATRQQAREDRRLELDLERQNRQEDRSQDMMKSLFSGIGKIGEKAFLPLAMMFMGSRMGGGNMMGMLGPLMAMMGEGAGGGGGLQDVLGSLSGMLGGGSGAGGLGGLSQIFGGMGGMPGTPGMMGAPAAANTNIGPPPPNAAYPESEPPTQMSEYERQRQAKFTVPPSDLYGYHQNPQPTPAAGQPEHIPNYSAPEPKFFTPDDFANYNVDQLMQMQKDGDESQASIQSFKQALNEAIRRKAPQQIPTQEAQIIPEPKETVIQETKTVSVTEQPAVGGGQPSDTDIAAAEQSGDIV